VPKISRSFRNWCEETEITNGKSRLFATRLGDPRIDACRSFPDAGGCAACGARERPGADRGIEAKYLFPRLLHCRITKDLRFIVAVPGSRKQRTLRLFSRATYLSAEVMPRLRVPESAFLGIKGKRRG
jgi:hypothetical protein